MSCRGGGFISLSRRSSFVRGRRGSSEPLELNNLHCKHRGLGRPLEDHFYSKIVFDRFWAHWGPFSPPIAPGEVWYWVAGVH